MGRLAHLVCGAILATMLATTLVFAASGTTDANEASTTARLTTETRVQLQAALQLHIDRTTVRGIYPTVDLKSGKVGGLHPAAGHPMILRLGDYYVLCAQFRDDAGKAVSVDFYVANRDRGFTIFRVEFSNRAPLETLLKNGIATMLE